MFRSYGGRDTLCKAGTISFGRWGLPIRIRSLPGSPGRELSGYRAMIERALLRPEIRQPARYGFPFYDGEKIADIAEGLGNGVEAAGDRIQLG